MLKKVFLKRSYLGKAQFIPVTVLAEVEEQAVRRYIRHCKFSRDIKYLGDIVLLPSGESYDNVFEYKEDLFSIFKINRPYQTEFQLIIMEIIIFGEKDPIIEKRSKCPYQIYNPFDESLDSKKIFYFPTIELAQQKLKELETKIEKSTLKGTKIKHNIPI